MIDLSRVEWRRSTYCANGSCVEVALLGSHVAVRNSKDRSGPLLIFTEAEWSAFLNGAVAGEFELEV